MNYKALIGVITIILTAVAYVPYIRDIFKGKTTPHAFTWFVGAFGTSIIYALQVSKGAGVGSWVTLAVALVSWFIFILALRGGWKSQDITKSDAVFLIASFIALYFWLVVDKPILSAVLIVTVDVCGFIPTIRKSWNKPYSETLFSYQLHTVRHGLSIFALEQFNVVTWLYPVAWTLLNGFFTGFLVIRRRRISEPSNGSYPTE